MSVINTNIQAIAGARNLNRSQEMLGRSLNRLSSGSKIVNPSDDAAGLAVSEKLDAQSLRVRAATTNVQNAISFVQTADGFMSGMTKILSRLSELAILGKDVTKNASDISLYQKEFTSLQDQLRQTIGGTAAQIGGTAVDTPLGQFNGIKLFGEDVASTSSTPDVTPGSPALVGTNFVNHGATIAAGVIIGNNVTICVGAKIDAGTVIGDNVTIGADSYIGPNQEIADNVVLQPGAVVDDQDNNILLHNYEVTAPDGTITSNLKLTSAGAIDPTTGALTAGNFIDADGNPVGTYALVTTATGVQVQGGLFKHSDGTFWTAPEGSNLTGLNAVTVSGTQEVVPYTVKDTEDITDAEGDVIGHHRAPSVLEGSIVVGTVTSSPSDGLSVTVGQAVGQTMSIPQISLRDGDMGAIIHQDAAGSYTLTLSSSDAIEAITNAIQDVANERAALGASQSRLELAATTLQVEFENLSSAISRIRDVDVAEESTRYAKYNILVQSGTAMLAQANSTPQSVLKLLQS